MNEVMIDIETLDTRSSAVVLSIGLLAFDGHTGKTVKELVLYPSFDEQVRAGRTMSLGTVRFWAEQGAGVGVSETFLDEQQRTRISRTRDALWSFYHEIHPPQVPHDQMKYTNTWANGDLFDLGIITSLFEPISDANRPLDSMPVPWAYNAPRDLRTVMREAARSGWQTQSVPENEAIHSAIADCRHQVQLLMSVRKFYRDNLQDMPL